MKKIISFYLVVILLMIEVFPTVSVYAAPPDTELRHSFHDNLTEGTQSATPVHTANTSNVIPDDRIFLSWDFSTANAMQSGNYELYYPLDDGKAARFILRMISTGRATVDFRIENGSEGPAVDPAAVAPVSIRDPSMYEIHSAFDLKGSTNYIPYREFMTGNHNFENAWDTQVVVDTTADPKTASFRLSPGFGISMKFDQYNIHFRWDSNGQFYFVTGGLKKGRIYDFTLSYWEGSGTAPSGDMKQSKKKIFSGLSDDDIKVQPYANGDADGTGRMTNALSEAIDKSVTPTTDPGDNRVDLDITFSLPNEWDPINHTFTKKPDTNSGYKLPMAMVFTGGTRTIELRVDDMLLDDDKVAISASPWLEANNHPPLVKKDDTGASTKITLSLHDLDYSTMYSEVQVSVTENADLYCRTTVLGFGRVYTYIYYGINETGSDYNIWFYPYKSNRPGVSSGYEGDYSLYDSNNANVPLMTRHSSGLDNMLNFPLSFSTEESIGKTFHITFTPSTRNITVKSQHLVFKPSFMPAIGMSEYFEAKVVSMVPESASNDDKASLVMDFKWDLGAKSNIDFFFKNYPKGTIIITYEFRRSEDPADRNPTPFARIIAEISNSVTSPGSLTVKFKDDPNSKLPGKMYTPGTETEQTMTTSLGKYYADAKVIIEAFRRASDVSATELFCYPGVYFINVTPVNVEDGSSMGDPKISSSLYSSITISDIAPTEISPPQNLTLYDSVLSEKEVSFKLAWEIAGEGLQNYLKSRFNEPILDEVDVYMNLYISSDEKLMRDTFSGYKDYKDYEERLDTDPTRLDNTSTFEAVVGDKTHLYLSGLDGNTPLTIKTPGKYIGKEARDVLRDDNIVALTNIPVDDTKLEAVLDSGYRLVFEDYIIDGLDPNEKYYVFADLIVETTPSTPGVYSFVVTSKLSNLVSITTSDKMQVPTGQDKVPPAPEAEIVDVGLKEATLRWKAVPDTTENVSMEYEIIRLKDTQLPTEMLESRDDFETVWKSKSMPENKLGLKTDIANNEFKLFDGSSFSSTADIAKYIPSLKTDPLTLKDVTLLPNQIYFYYIRTVKTVPGQEPLYSTWSRVTATTDIVKAPLDLKINTTEKIDDKTEVVIEFDALATASELGTAYNLQYQLKKDTDAWSQPIVMAPNVLRVSATKSAENEGYTHYVYKITGLETGTAYMVRVRMTDLSGDSSMYSNEANFRTGFDQKDYDTQWQTDSWLGRLKELLEKLLKEPYWISKKSTNEWEVVYRPEERFSALLAQTADSALILAQTQANKATYYIPASALAAANSANKGFKANHGKMEVMISPKAVSEAYNEAVVLIGDEIKKSNAADYYLRIQMDWTDVSNKVDGNDPLSQQVDVKMDIVGSSKLAKTVDSELMAELTIKLEAKLDDDRLKGQVEQNVKSSITDEDFVKFIEKIVEDSQSEFISAVNTKLSGTTKNSFPVTKLDYPIIIIASGLDPMASVSGYSYVNGSWMPIDVTAFGDNKAIYTNSPGTFIFTGRIIKIDGLDSMKYGGNISGIVAKYGLDDFLGVDGEIKMTDAADRSMVIESIARMAGAPKGADAIKWLKENMNMTVSSRNMYQPITTEESVYLVMSLYEAKSKTKISTIKIKNFNATKNITGMNDNYKQHIRAAFELGIYAEPQMQPKGTITIQNLFEMLGRLDAKLNL